MSLCVLARILHFVIPVIGVSNVNLTFPGLPFGAPADPVSIVPSNCLCLEVTLESAPILQANEPDLVQFLSFRVEAFLSTVKASTSFGD